MKGITNRANRFFYGMRPADRAAAQYAVGVRNDMSARYSPEKADMVADRHSDLDTKQVGYKHELNYRFVKLFDVRQRLAAGEDVPVGERAAWTASGSSWYAFEALSDRAS